MSGNTKRVFKALVMNPAAPDRIDFYDPGFLVIDNEKIVRIARNDPRSEFPDAEFRDLAEKIILPGFVDTHVHLPQFAIMGVGQGELLTWLNTYTYPEEARFADAEYAEKISTAFFDELVANGTTTAVIYCSVHERATDIAFTAARAKGVRAFIGKVMMDRNSPAALLENTDDSIRASTRLFEKWDCSDGGRLRYIFTPRFAASCSMPLMQRVGQIAGEAGAFVQSHLSENKDELQWIHNLFPNKPSYAAVYEDAGLLGERSIMAHCIHLSPEEAFLLAKRRVKVAFCPYSNRTLRSGTMPYWKLKDAGLTIALGTDIAGGPSLSMFEQMREAINATGMTPTEALYLATLAGANALSLPDRIGNFGPGKDADFVVAAAKAYRTPLDALSMLCLHGNKSSIVEVYVRGNLMYF
jgi:guanine deaminase